MEKPFSVSVNKLFLLLKDSGAVAVEYVFLSGRVTYGSFKLNVRSFIISIVVVSHKFRQLLRIREMEK